jgi:hypothetical protein
MVIPPTPFNKIAPPFPPKVEDVLFPPTAEIADEIRKFSSASKLIPPAAGIAVPDELETVFVDIVPETLIFFAARKIRLVPLPAAPTGL